MTDWIQAPPGLVFAVLAVGIYGVWQFYRRAGLQQISVQQAVELINREGALFLDVREAAELAAGRLPQALHIPLGQLEARWPELKPHQDKPLIVNCQLGGRSMSACRILKSHGFDHIYNLSGGFSAWQQAGLPFQK
ncbi:rhodanese-like domain-containing protein [Chitinivorax sp. PXF-14]|uniref:rhodanese-like domain-containing protein n=1 Tax=Chitinivorax sp. PXF-14 TaxID=3230488 RepID=UPI003467C7B4